MKSIAAKIASAAITAAALATPAVADPVYMIAQVEIEDHETFFSDYRAAAFPSMSVAGAKVLVATPTVSNLEGEWKGNWTVVIEFPSEEAAMEDCYNSVSYGDARDIRLSATSLNNFVIAPALVSPAQ